MNRAFPWIVLGLVAVWLLAKLPGPKAGADGMEVHRFGEISVSYNGRIKPFDTIARTLLRSVAERETFVDEKGERQPAIRWLLDVMVYNEDREKRARHHKVFRIVDPQIHDALALPEREGFRYSIDEFSERLPKLGEAMKQAHAKREAKTHDVYDRQLLDLENSLGAFESVASFRIPHMVPPSGDHEEWQTLPAAMGHDHGGQRDPNAEALVRILQAYALKDTEKFNQEVAAYLDRFAKGRSSDRSRASVESFFNRVDPFNWCKWVYLIVFILTACAWLGWSGPLNKAAYRLALFTLAINTLGFVIRVYLAPRGLVTNLYSSALLVGWGSVALALILERFSRLGVCITAASMAGFLSLMVADNLAQDGDTLEVMQAVLDTPFWLWTHVTCITLGYATTYLAGLIGIIYIQRGMFMGGMDEAQRRTLARMTYGVICFATFFSFVGTVLGGLWADDSWGRFWGWDPKENGALLIVLWNAILLHSRWGGLVRERGIAVLAVLGNIVVSWSWFGVNELSVGLHTYGFTEGRRFWLGAFMISQLLIAIQGMCLGGKKEAAPGAKSP